MSSASLNKTLPSLQTEVEGKTTVTPVRALARHRVLDVSMGPHHSAVIVESGHVYTFGRNAEGQLGTGKQKASDAPVEVKSLAEKSVSVSELTSLERPSRGEVSQCK